MNEQFTIDLGGCAPIPLAHYLKALGIIRLVSEQVDSNARCCWKDDLFQIESSLDRNELVDFFLDDYRPTPVLAPWNGGGGFYYQEEKLKEKDPKTGKKIKTGRRNKETAATSTVRRIAESASDRLGPYRASIEVIKGILAEMKLEEAPDKDLKDDLILAVRNSLSDSAIEWLDSSVLLTSERARFPPLLGTGGNDGNTDFTSNFMQRLSDIFDFRTGAPEDNSRRWIENSLFALNSGGLINGVAIGQFFPGAAGGANAQSGFESNSLVNPWDYVLMIEGSLFFASAAVRRLQTSMPGVLSYPFSVRASGAGYGSASDADEKMSRAEIWLPLWSGKTTSAELKMLMSEGRSTVGRRASQNGVDFARSLATLGIDRGIESFQRYGFLERNGLTYFATPLGRYPVRRQPSVDLLSEVDRWLLKYQEKSNGEKAPASAGRAFRRLQNAIFALVQGGGPRRVQDVLIALGECERAMVRSLKWAKESFLQPVPPLSEAWIREADDGSVEFRLAASLSSVFGISSNEEGKRFSLPIRSQVEPVHSWLADQQANVAFDDIPGRDVVWSEGDLISSMISIMSRRIQNSIQSGSSTWTDRGRICPEIGDVCDFIEGRVDVQRMADLFMGFILVNWRFVRKDAVKGRSISQSVYPGAGYGLLKQCFAGCDIRDVKVPIEPEIFRRAAIGDSSTAIRLAARRLRGSGLSPSIAVMSISEERMKRTAAALLFPLTESQTEMIADKVLRPEFQ